MIDDTHTTDSDLAGIPVLAALRDDIAKVLHDWDHGKQENDSPTDPCWHAWRVEAELLLPVIREYLSATWEDGVRGGGTTPNPYRKHVNLPCDACHDGGGWTGHHGQWEPCRACSVGGGR